MRAVGEEVAEQDNVAGCSDNVDGVRVKLMAFHFRQVNLRCVDWLALRLSCHVFRAVLGHHPSHQFVLEQP
jgi:hypothetical protein